MHACHRPRVTEHRFPDLGLNLIVKRELGEESQGGKILKVAIVD